MRRTVIASILIASLGIGPVAGGDLPRAYFEATGPGTWARYETTLSDGGKNTATYTRLADESGAFVVEVTTEFLEGPATGHRSVSIFVLDPDFDWKQRFLSFGKALSGATFVMEGRPPMPQPEKMVEAMRESMADFAGGFKAAGTTTRGGVECDLYTYKAVLGGPNSGTMGGEVCLNADVPFAVVHQTATSHGEKSGESSFETRLLESGAAPPRPAPMQAAVSAPEEAPGSPKAARTNIAMAFKRGFIALDFRVLANTGGRVFDVAVTNLGSEPLIVGAGTSTYAFEVGPPIGTLFFQPVSNQDLALGPGETSGVFRAAQTDERGVRSGSFRLVMVEGIPTFTGEVEVGKIE
jgi:hypothetical protein